MAGKEYYKNEKIANNLVSIANWSWRMSEYNKTLLEEIDKELQQLTIIVEAPTNNPRSGALDHKQPVASLQIPNKFFLLLDRKNCLEKLLGTSVSKHSEIANFIIEAGGMKIGKNATTAEERLKRQSTRYIYSYVWLRSTV